MRQKIKSYKDLKSLRELKSHKELKSLNYFKSCKDSKSLKYFKSLKQLNTLKEVEFKRTILSEALKPSGPRALNCSRASRVIIRELLLESMDQDTFCLAVPGN